MEDLERAVRLLGELDNLRPLLVGSFRRGTTLRRMIVDLLDRVDDFLDRKEFIELLEDEDESDE